tara:strand:+ start:294 stop:719 length:426 start_codon:yes stop_codon:yes gene_type:complete
MVRLIVSINRSLSLLEAEENVHLAIRYRRHGVVGIGKTLFLRISVFLFSSVFINIYNCKCILKWLSPLKTIAISDLSGNPEKGSFDAFKQLLELAREEGMKITVHTGEVPNSQGEISITPTRNNNWEEREDLKYKPYPMFS